MTREVRIFIRGLQAYDGQGEDGAVETAVTGQYFYKNGRHYLIYEENSGETGAVTKSRIRMTDGCVELIRRGELETEMVFLAGGRTASRYRTPYGSFTFGIVTDRAELWEEADRIEARVDYALEIDGGKAADCRIRIRVVPLI